MIMATFDKDELEVEAEFTEDLDDEETYVAYLDDIKDLEVLLPDAEERLVRWDDDEYEYYHDSEDDGNPSDEYEIE